jgi:HEAT repeat protein
VDAAVLTAVNVDVNARFASVDQFSAAFDEACRQSLALTKHRRPGALPARLNPWVISAWVLLLAGIGIFLGIFFARDTDGPSVAAVAAVARDGPTAPPPEVDPAAVVKEALASSHAAVRRRAIESAGQLRRLSLEPALRRALHDDDPNVRRAAARALGAMGESDRVAEKTRATLARMLDSRDGAQSTWLRLEVAGALCRLGDDRGIDALHRQLQQIGKIPAPSRTQAQPEILEALARCGDPTARDLFEHLSGSWRSRLRRLGLLARLRHARSARRARRELDQALGDDAWDQRVAAARALSATDPEPARRTLEAALASGLADIRIDAAIALAQDLGDASGSRILVESLRSADERKAIEIALGLGHLGDEGPSRDAVLRWALREGERDLRLAAAMALLDR